MVVILVVTFTISFNRKRDVQSQTRSAPKKGTEVGTACYSSVGLEQAEVVRKQSRVGRS